MVYEFDCFSEDGHIGICILNFNYTLLKFNIFSMDKANIDFYN